MEGSWLLILIGTLFALASADRPEARIIGGHEVNVIKHPYLVSIRYRSQANETYVHKCAGAIYSERAIVTAAQCVTDIKDNAVMIVAAANSRTGSDGMLFPALKSFSHPNYSSWTVDYDVGDNRPQEGKMATVAGWGYREEFGPSSANLEEVEVPIVSSDECTKSYGMGEITERMICAGFLKTGGKDSCQGDTGGPLVVDDALVGLVSWGRGCARPGYPTVYTFVAALKEWIDETIADYV